MNVIEIVGIVIVLLIVITTFITEPKLSFEYFKACVVSIGKIITKTKEMVNKDQINKTEEVVTKEQDCVKKMAKNTKKATK